jgi:hypothetical protein
MNLKDLSRRRVQKQNSYISKKLVFEIEAMKKLLEERHKKLTKKKKLLSKGAVSDYLADICRMARYKIQNGR